ncbi:hypothetical protein KUL42_16730 [Alteromonas sp. KUL42]|uniref:hypothetical protein n=1 Tax=Alteromonas sp. KUL42 TaxID=2480797 RepID=UPI001035FDC5|nr:hypothetical protein [Alteromonas sp. KUL42]TAP36694.1 hypothetical protein EYR97_08260 [Alteromonas sp. KUL42]GEA06912.1 hypothetical protein KUL42_16730 [Alteromonas sp. KUL42]
MKYLVLSLFLTISLGCSTSNKLEKPESSIVSKEFSNEVRTKLLGKWCGTKKHDDGLLQQWNVERHEDGSYRVDFSTTASDGSQENWSEFGMWGVRYPIYFTAVQGFSGENGPYRANTKDPDLYDAYTIIEIEEEHFTYKSFTSGNTFTLHRKCN